MFLDLLRKDNWQKFFEWALYVFIAVFPFLFYSNYLFYGTTSRWLNLVFFTEVLAIIFGFLLFKKEVSLKIFKSPITLSLLALFIVSFISALLGVDFTVSFWSRATRMTGLFYFFHIGIFYLLLLGLFDKVDRLKRFLKIFLVSAGFFSVGSLLYKDGFNLIFINAKWSGFTFGNSTFAGMYAYVAFIASVYFVIWNENFKQKWWRFFIPVIFAINPYLLNKDLWSGGINIIKNPLAIGEAQASSFAMFFSLVAFVVMWLVFKIKNDNLKKKVITGLVVLGIILVSIATLSFLSRDGYLQKLLMQSYNARPIVWELSRKSITEKPFFGWGIDNFDRSFEKNYDNRILEVKNGAEPWFDRAHNIFVDQAVETGYIGLIAYIFVYITIFGSVIYIIFKSTSDKERKLALVLATYFFGHILELQTGFDTTISYVPLAVMFALSASLFHRVYSSSDDKRGIFIVPNFARYGVGTVLIVLYGFSMFFGVIPIIRSQNANANAHVAGSSEERLLLYPIMFSSHLDRANLLWRTTHDFQRGIAKKPYLLDDPKKKEGFIKELAFFNEEFRKYANEHKNDYRIRVSLAATYIYERLLGVDHLAEAHQVLDDCIKLSPKIPQAHWMKAVAYLYQGKFDLAREWAKKAYDMNPEIEQSVKIVRYIEESIKTFPEMNFYTFAQI